MDGKHLSIIGIGLGCLYLILLLLYINGIAYGGTVLMCLGLFIGYLLGLQLCCATHP